MQVAFFKKFIKRNSHINMSTMCITYSHLFVISFQHLWFLPIPLAKKISPFLLLLSHACQVWSGRSTPDLLFLYSVKSKNNWFNHSPLCVCKKKSLIRPCIINEKDVALSTQQNVTYAFTDRHLDICVKYPLIIARILKIDYGTVEKRAPAVFQCRPL